MLQSGNFTKNAMSSEDYASYSTIAVFILFCFKYYNKRDFRVHVALEKNVM